MCPGLRNLTAAMPPSSTHQHHPSSYLLDLAAADDLPAFRRAIQEDNLSLVAASPWYGPSPKTTTNNRERPQLALHLRTPAMVAALYGSTTVLSYVLSIAPSEAARASASDGATPLLLAHQGRAPSAPAAARLLLTAAAGGHQEAQEGLLRLPLRPGPGPGGRHQRRRLRHRRLPHLQLQGQPVLPRIHPRLDRVPLRPPGRERAPPRPAPRALLLRAMPGLPPRPGRVPQGRRLRVRARRLRVLAPPGAVPHQALQGRGRLPAPHLLLRARRPPAPRRQPLRRLHGLPLAILHPVSNLLFTILKARAHGVAQLAGPRLRRRPVQAQDDDGQGLLAAGLLPRPRRRVRPGALLPAAAATTATATAQHQAAHGAERPRRRLHQPQPDLRAPLSVSISGSGEIV